MCDFKLYHYRQGHPLCARFSLLAALAVVPGLMREHDSDRHTKDNISGS